MKIIRRDDLNFLPVRRGEGRGEGTFGFPVRTPISYRFHTDFEVGDKPFAAMLNARPKACFISAQGNALGGRGQFPLQAESLVHIV
jgi:hypothetical protein